MRIIVRILQVWGNQTSQGFDIDPNISIHEFKTKISNRLSIPIQKILIKFTRDDYTVYILSIKIKLIHCKR